MKVFNMEVDGPINGTFSGQIDGDFTDERLVKDHLKGEVVC